MQIPRATTKHYRQQQQIAAATVTASHKLWRRMGDNFDQSWLELKPRISEVVGVGRLAAATSSAEYTPAVLAETGQVAAPAGRVNPAAFTRFAPDGRDMGSLLDTAVIRTKTAVGAGATSRAALEASGAWLSGVLLTVMADTSRGVVGADIAQRPSLTGYVRMVNPGACSRCIILAGKWFRWNAGFQRHPNCYCTHIPAAENIAGNMLTDPYAYFNSLSKEQQEKVFGRIEARAIRDGADIYRVENIKLRGLATAKGNLRYGTPSRMTVDDIYRVAGTRTNAIRLMAQEGYITGPQVAGGNILGAREGFGQLGKGGAARGASDAVTAARNAGVRDPLNRYTMTSAERRLYDAKFKLDAARSGVYPQSVGLSSADKFVRPRPPTPVELSTFEKAYRNELDRLHGNPMLGVKPAARSVQNLARLLGIL